MVGAPILVAANDAEQSRKSAKTLIEFAYQAMRKDIIRGKLQPGQKLRIEQLRAHYDVGSSTLREALTLLVADSLVTSEGQRGFKVAPISMDDLRDLTRMRKMMEALALRESIAQGDDDWEAGVVAAFHRLSLIEERLDRKASDDLDAWEDSNRDFHEALISACTSRWLRHFREILYFQSERYRRFCLVSRGSHRDIHIEHKALLEAALARNGDLICSLIEAHIENTLSSIIQLQDIPNS